MRFRAVQTFPSQFARFFGAILHPAPSAADLSTEAASLYLVLSCLVAGAFARPACQRFFRIADRLDFPGIWYSTVALSAIFLLMNILTSVAYI